MNIWINMGHQNFDIHGQFFEGSSCWELQPCFCSGLGTSCSWDTWTKWLRLNGYTTTRYSTTTGISNALAGGWHNILMQGRTLMNLSENYRNTPNFVCWKSSCSFFLPIFSCPFGAYTLVFGPTHVVVMWSSHFMWSTLDDVENTLSTFYFYLPHSQ